MRTQEDDLLFMREKKVLYRYSCGWYSFGNRYYLFTHIM